MQAWPHPLEQHSSPDAQSSSPAHISKHRPANPRPGEGHIKPTVVGGTGVVLQSPVTSSPPMKNWVLQPPQ